MAYDTPTLTNPAPEFEAVTSLAIASNDSTKMAVAVSSKGDGGGSKEHYFFVVYTATGQHASLTTKISNQYKFHVLPGQGMVMNSDKIFTTYATKETFLWGNQEGFKEGACSSNKQDGRMRLSAVDPSKNSVSFYKESSWYGRSTALLLAGSDLWMAGTTTSSQDSPNWMFSIFKVSMTDGSTSQGIRFSPNVLAYYGVTSGEYTIIKHFALQGDVFFGTFENITLNGKNDKAGVWFAKQDASDIKVINFASSSSDYGSDKTTIIGMRPFLEGTKVHLIVRSSDQKNFHYIIVDESGATPALKKIIYEASSGLKAYHSVWFEPAGAPTFVLDSNDSTQVAYNSFTVGYSKVPGVESAFLMATNLVSTNSCYNQAGSPHNWSYTSSTTKSLSLTSYFKSTNTINFDTTFPTMVSYEDSNFCMGDTKISFVPWILTASWSLTTTNLYTDTLCDSATTTTDSPGSMPAGTNTHLLGVQSTFAFTPPTILSPAGCPTPTAWIYQVIWGTTTYPIQKYLSVHVDSVNNQIIVMSRGDTNGDFGAALVTGSVWTFVIKSVLPNGTNNSFNFAVTIDASSVCKVTTVTNSSGKVTNQKYNVGDPLFQYDIPDFIYTPSSCSSGVVITNSVTPAATFINNNGGVGKIVSWSTSNGSDAGTYIIKKIAKWGIYTAEEQFTLTVVAVCGGVTTFTSPGSQTNPAVFQYTSSSAVFTFSPYTILPVECLPTYACSSTPVDLCSIPSVSSFDTATGNYSFKSSDSITYPPGNYIFSIVITAGGQTQTATFTLTLALPPLVLKASPFKNVTLYLGDPGKEFAFDPAQLIEPVALSSYGQIMVGFFKEDGKTALDPDVFGVTLDGLGSSVSPLTTKQVNDSKKLGSYKVVYKVWLQNYPTLSVTSAPFVVELLDPCASATIKVSTSPFTDQTYLIGDPEIRQTWTNAALATLSISAQCGDFAIKRFYTKAGTTKTPLDSKLFKVDLEGSAIAITGTDPSINSLYTVYFEVMLANYPTNVIESPKPFKVTVTKPNSAPTLTGLSKTQSTYQLDIPAPPEASYNVPIGIPQDAENDKVKVEFDNGGEALLVLDATGGQVVVGAGILDGLYTVKITLTDDNAKPLSTTYSVAITVTHKLSEPKAETTQQTRATEIEAPKIGPLPNNNIPPPVVVTNVPKPQETVQPDQKNKKVPQPPQMKLDEMDALGLLTFTFDQAMVIPKNLTWINETVLDVEIITSQYGMRFRDLQEDEVTASVLPNLNFTWNITDFEQNKMELQLYFEEAYYVMPRHSMSVKILVKEFFVTNSTFMTLQDSNLNMQIVCKPQMQLGGATEAFGAAASATEGGTKGIMAANLAMNLVLSGALSLLWGMINGLQILSMLPMVNVDMPGNAQVVFSQIYTIAAFNIVNVDFITSAIAKWFRLEITSEGVSPRMQAMGFETTNTIMNLGIVFIFILISCSALFLQLLLKLFSWINCKYQESIKRLEQKLANKLYWNFFIRLFIETYIDQAFVQALKLKNAKYNHKSEAVTSILSWLIVASLIVAPIITWACLLKNKKVLGYESVKHKYEAAYEFVRYRDKLALGYSAIFMTKRLIFAMFVMLFEFRRVLQTMLILHLLLIGAIYTIAARPLEDRVTNAQEGMNDLICFIIAYCLIFFGDFLDDPKTKYKMGWVVVGMIAFNIFINLAIILGVSGAQIKRRWKYYLRDFKSKFARCLIRLRNKEDVEDNSTMFIKRMGTMNKSIDVGNEKLESLEDDLEKQNEGEGNASSLRNFKVIEKDKQLGVIQEESNSNSQEESSSFESEQLSDENEQNEDNTKPEVQKHANAPLNVEAVLKRSTLKQNSFRKLGSGKQQTIPDAPADSYLMAKANEVKADVENSGQVIMQAQSGLTMRLSRNTSLEAILEQAWKEQESREVITINIDDNRATRNGPQSNEATTHPLILQGQETTTNEGFPQSIEQINEQAVNQILEELENQHIQEVRKPNFNPSSRLCDYLLQDT